jgi:hypothetical protein
MALPSADESMVMHERVAAPSKWISHEPQIPMPQPNLVPVKPNSSRKTHNSGRSGSLSTV